MAIMIVTTILNYSTVTVYGADPTFITNLDAGAVNKQFVPRGFLDFYKGSQNFFQLAFTVSGALTADLTFVISGVNANGESVTETLTLPSGTTTPTIIDSANFYTSLTSLVQQTASNVTFSIGIRAGSTVMTTNGGLTTHMIVTETAGDEWTLTASLGSKDPLLPVSISEFIPTFFQISADFTNQTGNMDYPTQIATRFSTFLLTANPANTGRIQWIMNEKDV